MKKWIYLPFLAYDTEEDARIILKHLDYTVVGRILKISERVYNKLGKKTIKY